MQLNIKARMNTGPNSTK